MATFDDHHDHRGEGQRARGHVFTERDAARAAPATAVIGHTRYSTSGSANWTAAQPVYRYGRGRPDSPWRTTATSPTPPSSPQRAGSRGHGDALGLGPRGRAARRARSPPARRSRRRWRAVLPVVEGAYSMVVLEAGAVHAVRDPYGFRPLCLGRLGTADAPEGWVVASESPALDLVGATFVREVAPGELVTHHRRGRRLVAAARRRPTSSALCIFEFVYFARPDAYLMGRQVHSARRRMGELLASQAPRRRRPRHGRARTRACPRPRASPSARGSPSATGWSRTATSGARSSRPTRTARAAGVRRKLNPLRENIEGQRLVVVDDSIVRGTTTRAIVTMLRDAGARRGPPADLVAALRLALLLRDRHADARRAARGQPLGRRDARLHRRATRSSSSRWRTCARPSGSTASAATPA